MSFESLWRSGLSIRTRHVLHGVSLVIFAFVMLEGISAAPMKKVIINKEGQFKEVCRNQQMPCANGMILPRWHGPGGINKFCRAFTYALGIIYMFTGVSILSDKFMEAIEEICSQEKTVTIKVGLNTEKVTVKAWNDTVANLTLMALGSSAPEILLAIIEIVGNDFESGQLGPGTIVGSAAFNLFVIIGICVSAIPAPEAKSIEKLRVYFVTSAFSLFAYLWLWVILAFNSPGILTIVEGAVTFAFFPVLVAIAYMVDTGRYFCYKSDSAEIEPNRTSSMFDETGTSLALVPKNYEESAESHGKMLQSEGSSKMRKRQKLMFEIMQKLHYENPEADLKEVHDKAASEAMKTIPKSYAFYHMAAARRVQGRGKVLKSKYVTDEVVKFWDHKVTSNMQRVFFAPDYYSVMENCGTMKLVVLRGGGDLNVPISVRYNTRDGTAMAGRKFREASGELKFGRGQAWKEITVEIIDDKRLEPDTFFNVILSNARVDGSNSPAPEITGGTALVMIWDDDNEGQVVFDEHKTAVPESKGHVDIRLNRRIGGGKQGESVSIPYYVRLLSNCGKQDVDLTPGWFRLQRGQNNGAIKVTFTDRKTVFGPDRIFSVELGNPVFGLIDVAQTAVPPRTKVKGIKQKTKIIIKVAEAVKKTLKEEGKGGDDKDEPKNAMSQWAGQFADAFKIGDDDDDDDDKDNDDYEMPSVATYIWGYLSFPWKLMVAFIPPTGLLHGWVTFCFSLLMLACQTAMISDLASHFGCTVGLLDQVNSISVVALGTSLPDMFASKVAAQKDQYADASVGNVTGSNAVNVFLGIGLAWTLAAIVQWHRGNELKVDPGSLGFSVMVFCCLATIAIVVLFLRRSRVIGGELGGPLWSQRATTFLFTILWGTYIGLSALEAYCVINL